MGGCGAFNRTGPGEANTSGLALGLVQVALFMGIIAYQWLTRRRAQLRTSLPLRNRLLIPIYIWILWAYIAAILYAGLHISTIEVPQDDDDGIGVIAVIPIQFILAAS